LTEVLQKAVREAARNAGIVKPASPHKFFSNPSLKTALTFALFRNRSDTEISALGISHTCSMAAERREQIG
jgi:hypothetical protein